MAAMLRRTRQLIWGRRPGRRLFKVALFFFSLFLFILAVALMKDGARILAPLLQGSFVVSTPAAALGFGWLFAYVVLSGSPVAAAALTFFDAGVVDQVSTFTMITGSRMGASFIVLFLGFLYVLRGRSRAAGLSMGLLSLSITGAIHILGLPVGLAMLGSPALAWQPGGTSNGFQAIYDALFTPAISWLMGLLPAWGLFPAGLVMIMVSFSLFDRCLPQMTLKESHLGRMSQLVYNRWIMLALGAGITLISMSVSVSLGILVPLSNRGVVRRENVIPYILGANVATFIDTLLAALLLDNPQASAVVVAEIGSVALVSILILVLAYHPFERAMLSVVNWVTGSNRNLTVFMVGIVGVPIFLLFM